VEADDISYWKITIGIDEEEDYPFSLPHFLKNMEHETFHIKEISQDYISIYTEEGVWIGGTLKNGSWAFNNQFVGLMVDYVEENNLYDQVMSEDNFNSLDSISPEVAIVRKSLTDYARATENTEVLFFNGESEFFEAGTFMRSHPKGESLNLIGQKGNFPMGFEGRGLEGNGWNNPNIMNPNLQGPPIGFDSPLSPYQGNPNTMNPNLQGPPTGFGNPLSSYQGNPNTMNPNLQGPPTGFGNPLSPYQGNPNTISGNPSTKFGNPIGTSNSRGMQTPTGGGPFTGLNTGGSFQSSQARTSSAGQSSSDTSQQYSSSGKHK